MTKYKYVVSMFLGALLSASLMTIGYTVADVAVPDDTVAPASQSVCIKSLNYDALTDEQLEERRSY